MPGTFRSCNVRRNASWRRRAFPNPAAATQLRPDCAVGADERGAAIDDVARSTLQPRCGGVRKAWQVLEIQIVSGVRRPALLAATGGGGVALKAARDVTVRAAHATQGQFRIQLDAIRAHRGSRPPDSGVLPDRRTGRPRGSRLPCSRVMMADSCSMRRVSPNHPAWLVISPGATGTKRPLVRTNLERQRLRGSGRGSPSMVRLDPTAQRGQ